MRRAAPPSPRSTTEDFETLYLFGAGGHGRELAWLAQEIWGGSRRIAFLVDDPRFLLGPVNGIPVQLLDETVLHRTSRYIIAIGDPHARRRIDGAMASRGARPATMVHPRAERSGTVTLGEGSVLAAGSVTTTNVTLGRHVHVDVGSTISHDVTIDDFTSISPGVHIAGHVHVGAGVFIGVGATIINGTDRDPLVVGAGATIAAGACVIRPVPPGAVVVGVPARVRPSGRERAAQ